MNKALFLNPEDTAVMRTNLTSWKMEKMINTLIKEKM